MRGVGTSTTLPPMPQDGPVDPKDYPEGIEWEELEYDPATGQPVYRLRNIPVGEWNENYALSTKEAEAFKALQRAEAAMPFRFIQPERLLPAFADGRTRAARASGIVGEMTRQRGIELEALLNKSASRVTLTRHERKQLRWAVRLLLVELSVTRQENIALRQRMAELEADIGAARNRAAEVVDARSSEVGTSA